jgi:hypothetical protein
MKKKIIKKIKSVESVLSKDSIKPKIMGAVTINDEELEENKDFFLTDDGITLSKEAEKKLKDKNTTSYSFIYSRRIVRQI